MYKYINFKMPLSYLPMIAPPDYKKKHGEHAFMDLSDYNNEKPLKLYRSDKDESKLERGIMFYGTDLRGIETYIKSNTYWEWTLSEEDKNLLFDLTDIKNQNTLDKIFNKTDINEIKEAFIKTKKIGNNNSNNPVVFNYETKFEDLKTEKEHYLEEKKEGENYNILYVRKSDELKDDIKFVEIMKRLLPKSKGTYTKCLQPLFGDSLSHAEVIIWDEELNERLFNTGEIITITDSSSASPRSPFPSHRSSFSSSEFTPPPLKKQRSSGGYLNSKTLKKKRQHTQKSQGTNNSKTFKKKRQNRQKTKVSNKLKTLKKMRQRTQRNTRSKKTKILKKNI